MKSLGNKLYSTDKTEIGLIEAIKFIDNIIKKDISEYYILLTYSEYSYYIEINSIPIFSGLFHDEKELLYITHKGGK